MPDQELQTSVGFEKWNDRTCIIEVTVWVDESGTLKDYARLQVLREAHAALGRFIDSVDTNP